MTPETVFDGVAADAKILLGYASGMPPTLVDALAAHAREAPGATLYAGLVLGDSLPIEDVVRSGALTLRSFHISGPMRRWWREGLVDYLPLRMSDVAPVLLGQIGMDVALVRVGPPDADGWCGLGVSTAFTAAAIRGASLVIAEVDESVPRARGESRVHVDDLDRAIPAALPAPAYAQGRPDEISRAVAQRVRAVIPDGATVQLGIGTIPELLALELVDDAAPKRLGLIGIITDPMVPLVEAIDAAGRGPVQVLEVLGSEKLMRWADDNPMFEMRSSATLHNPVALAGIEKLVSVNSALAVDLSGQVVAETVGATVIAGVGGSMDLYEGAHLSPGGLRVLALRATTRTGASTIVASHAGGALVSLPHHSVDVVVTEHGAAWLRGRSLRERRAAMCEIAAPEHREALRAALS